MSRFAIRRAEPGDAAAIAAALERAFKGLGQMVSPAMLTAEGVAAALQTGSEMLIAERPDGPVAAAVRFSAEEGVLWFDCLGSVVPGAGREVVRAVERRAQERGLRFARTRLPADDRTAWAFQRWGYVPVAGEGGNGSPRIVVVERRLPLLTVREQRRADAAAIAALTGEDPWQFEQGARPGWFILADGERVAGVISVREAQRGVARVSPPVLAEEYRGRGIELWMIGVAVRYAQTGAFHTAVLPALPETERLRRDLEDRRWQREAWSGSPHYVLTLGEETLQPE